MLTLTLTLILSVRSASVSLSLSLFSTSLSLSPSLSATAVQLYSLKSSTLQLRLGHERLACLLCSPSRFPRFIFYVFVRLNTFSLLGHPVPLGPNSILEETPELAYFPLRKEPDGSIWGMDDVAS